MKNRIRQASLISRLPFLVTETRVLIVISIISANTLCIDVWASAFCTWLNCSVVHTWLWLGKIIFPPLPSSESPSLFDPTILAGRSGHCHLRNQLLQNCVWWKEPTDTSCFTLSRLVVLLLVSSMPSQMTSVLGDFCISKAGEWFAPLKFLLAGTTLIKETASL